MRMQFMVHRRAHSQSRQWYFLLSVLKATVSSAGVLAARSRRQARMMPMRTVLSLCDGVLAMVVPLPANGV
jgi:hypothetical protein